MQLKDIFHRIEYSLDLVRRDYAVIVKRLHRTLPKYGITSQDVLDSKCLIAGEMILQAIYNEDWQHPCLYITKFNWSIDERIQALYNNAYRGSIQFGNSGGEIVRENVIFDFLMHHFDGEQLVIHDSQALLNKKHQFAHNYTEQIQLHTHEDVMLHDDCARYLKRGMQLVGYPSQPQYIIPDEAIDDLIIAQTELYHLGTSFRVQGILEAFRKFHEYEVNLRGKDAQYYVSPALLSNLIQ